MTYASHGDTKNTETHGGLDLAGNATNEHQPKKRLCACSRVSVSLWLAYVIP